MSVYIISLLMQSKKHIDMSNITNTVEHTSPTLIDEKIKLVKKTLPALLGAPRPIGPAETVGCDTDGLGIHPARDVVRGAGVG